jgi:hypothetical protein
MESLTALFQFSGEKALPPLVALKSTKSAPTVTPHLLSSVCADKFALIRVMTARHKPMTVCFILNLNFDFEVIDCQDKTIKIHFHF